MRWKPVLIFARSEPRRPSIGSQPNVPLNVVRFHAERFWTSDAWHQSYIVQLFHVAFDMNLMQDVAAFKVNNDEATDRLHAVLVRNAIAHQVLDALVFQGSERVCCREGREIRRRPEIVLRYRFPAAHGRNSQKLRPAEQRCGRAERGIPAVGIKECPTVPRIIRSLRATCKLRNRILEIRATGRTCPVISVINADQHMEPVPRSSTYEKEGEQNRGD